MSRNIDDISSIFWVSGHPDTNFAKENRFLEKSEKIAYILVNYQYIRHKSDTKIQACEKIKIKHKLADISTFIVDISASLCVFEKFFKKKKQYLR